MDIPSLFMIPSAVSSGKVHSVFPNSTDADFQFNRDSDATRVNSEGLIERVGYYGSEEITNNTFSSATGWTLESGWSIANNYAVANTTSGYIYQIGSGLTNGKKYKVTFSISEYESGSVFFGFGTGLVLDAGASVSANGDYTQFVDLTTSGTKYVGFKGVSFTGKINNFSVKEVTGDRARLNYEIEGGLVNTKPSLLLEPQSTNLVTYSEAFDNVYWAKSNVSVTSGFISPNGTSNAFKLVEGTSTGTHYITRAIGSADGSTNTVSLFVKKAERTHLTIYSGGGFSDSSTFNLNNGTSINNGTSTSKIEDMSNNWYKCSVTSVNKSKTIYIMTNNGESGTSGVVYTGDGTSGVYIFGAMLEESSYSTSYIPTNGASQTRAAETCTGAGTSSILPSEEGILYSEIAALANDGTVRYLGLSDGSSGNRVVIINDGTTNNIRGIVSSGGTKYVDFAFVVSDVTIFNKVALKWKANDFQLWINGVKRVADLSGSSPIGLDRLSFDLAGSNTYDGKIRDIRVYNTKEMTDSEVDILLTKITS